MGSVLENYIGNVGASAVMGGVFGVGVTAFGAMTGSDSVTKFGVNMLKATPLNVLTASFFWVITCNRWEWIKYPTFGCYMGNRVMIPIAAPPLAQVAFAWFNRGQ